MDEQIVSMQMTSTEGTASVASLFQSNQTSAVSGDFFSMLLAQLSASMGTAETEGFTDYLVSQFSAFSEGFSAMPEMQVSEGDEAFSGEMLPFPYFNQDNAAEVFSQMQEMFGEINLTQGEEIPSLADIGMNIINESLLQTENGTLTDFALLQHNPEEILAQSEVNVFQTVPNFSETAANVSAASEKSDVMMLQGESLLTGESVDLSTSELPENARMNSDKGVNEMFLNNELQQAQADELLEQGKFDFDEESFAENFLGNDSEAEENIYLEEMLSVKPAYVETVKPVADAVVLNSEPSPFSQVEDKLREDTFGFQEAEFESENESDFAEEETSGKGKEDSDSRDTFEPEVERIFRSEDERVMRTEKSEVHETKYQQKAEEAKMVAEQLVKSAQFKQMPNSSEFVLSLKPEYLGDLKVSVAVEGDSVVTRLVAQNTQTRELLSENVDVLRQAFEDAGLDCEEIEISSGNEDDFFSAAKDSSGYGLNKKKEEPANEVFSLNGFDEISEIETDEAVGMEPSAASLKSDLYQINFLV